MTSFPDLAYYDNTEHQHVIIFGNKLSDSKEALEKLGFLYSKAHNVMFIKYKAYIPNPAPSAMDDVSFGYLAGEATDRTKRMVRLMHDDGTINIIDYRDLSIIDGMDKVSFDVCYRWMER